MKNTDTSFMETLENEPAGLHIRRPAPRALVYCRKEKLETLLVPRGVYLFKEYGGNAHLDLDGMENFLLDGQGSEFIFQTCRPYLSPTGYVSRHTGADYDPHSPTCMLTVM